MQHFLDFNIFNGTVNDCVREISGVIASGSRSCHWLACINVHADVVSRSDGKFTNALRSADWLVPDGIGIMMAGWIAHRPLKERITGSDIFDGVMNHLNERGGSVFFLGSTDETLEIITKKLKFDFPNIRLAGTYSPPFKADFSELELLEMRQAVNEVSPDVLWVGMTAPKQEKWLLDCHQYLEVGFAGAVGAVFNFYTGEVRRAHPVFRRVGLEWLIRLARQPKRHWRRMRSIPVFLFHILLSVVRRN